MTTISHSATQLATPDLLGRFVRRLGIWAYAVATYWVRRAATKTLRELSDRELRDIGIQRCDIEAAVRGNFHPDMGWFGHAAPTRKRRAGG